MMAPLAREVSPASKAWHQLGALRLAIISVCDVDAPPPLSAPSAIYVALTSRCGPTILKVSEEGLLGLHHFHTIIVPLVRARIMSLPLTLNNDRRRA